MSALLFSLPFLVALGVLGGRRFAWAMVADFAMIYGLPLFGIGYLISALAGIGSFCWVATRPVWDQDPSIEFMMGTLWVWISPWRAHRMWERAIKQMPNHDPTGLLMIGLGDTEAAQRAKTMELPFVVHLPSGLAILVLAREQGRRVMLLGVFKDFPPRPRKRKRARARAWSARPQEKFS